MKPRRSIHALIAAAAARDPLTATERRRLTRYDHHWRRIVDALTSGELARATRRGTLHRWEWTGDEYPALRTEMLSGLRRKNVPELIGMVRGLVALLRLAEDHHAELKGLRRRMRRQHQGAQKAGTEKKLKIVDEHCAAIDKLQKRNPALTTRAAARKHLHQLEPPAWMQGSDADRDRQITNLVKSIYRRKKNKGH